LRAAGEFRVNWWSKLGAGEAPQFGVRDNMGNRMKPASKLIRVLSIGTVWFGLLYSLMEALDSWGLTGGNTEFEILALLLIFSVFVVLAHLVAFAVRMLVCGSRQMLLSTPTRASAPPKSCVGSPSPPGLVPLRI